ncbi:MAG: FGGY-family carbohydrate kinase [Sulfitobacter sp.]
MSGLALGIDIGTSGVRTAVVAPDGSVVSQARASHEAQDPENIDAMAWWRAVEKCLYAQWDGLRDLGYAPSDISRIGVDGTSGSMVLADAALVPVTRALMYNSAGFDAEAKLIDTLAPSVHITKGSNSALARAMHLHAEDTQGKARHLLHQADFIAAKLLGRGGVSDHNNALKTGFDPETEDWPDWIEATGLPRAILPQVVPAGAAIGQISAARAAQHRLSPTTQIHAGTTDSIAAFLAAAPMELGAAVTSLGTTLAVKILSDTRIDDPAIGLYSHRLGAFWLTGGASNTGGGVLASLFSSVDLVRLSALIDPSTQSPLEYYPLIKPGERFPVNDPTYAPCMTPRPTEDAAFLHGLLESIARIEAQCYAAIAERGGAMPTMLFTAGGGAHNPTWSKIRERVLGLSLSEAGSSEASVGTARLIQSA